MLAARRYAERVIERLAKHETDSSAAAAPAQLPGVDAYIARAKPFAQPLLRHLREAVHRAVPEVEEQIK